MSGPRQAFIGVGTNIGARHENIKRALHAIERDPAIERVDRSPIYESEPVGVTEQPRFLNMVAGIETSLEPEGLMARLLDVEKRMGRVRIQRWGPRIIDLDLLLYENETRDTPGLRLPHPRLRERAFVVIPLLDLLRQARYNREPWISLRGDIEALGLNQGKRKLWLVDETSRKIG